MPRASVGGHAAVPAPNAEFGVPTRALLSMPLESFDPQECPQCRAGVPIDDPGSRRA